MCISGKIIGATGKEMNVPNWKKKYSLRTLDKCLTD